MLALLGYAVLFGEPWMVAFAALNAILIAWTHRRDLVRPPQLRSWVTNIFSGEAGVNLAWHPHALFIVLFLAVRVDHSAGQQPHRSPF